MKKKTEESIQISVCNYLRIQYPSALFICDVASGMKLTIGQAVKAQRMRKGRGWPDIFIAQKSGDRCGLFIELKKEGTVIWNKDGTIRKDDHLIEQGMMHEWLTSRGYQAQFAIGFDEAKQIIDNYLNEGI